ncbi:MAG: bifunctional UDP-N-acetylmuramoyl-tripeptide:D-alanyl-D-alanine ligase/alanine racemase, partial [Duncaniella sp.]|nr:bifunctional UDP-N-acetylmuramoyl-tripeptide:D-alanyl-D-alanine ligase/alanine racemase [Duncaniella sp.]
MKYDIQHIADRIGSKAYLTDGTTVIKHILTDSRSLMHPEGTLFFALRTQTGDGHRYLKSLYDAGVRNFVVSDTTGITQEMMPEANVIVSDDTLEAMRRLATMCREDSRATVIAITGSRGKTTVKEWLAHALESAGPLARSPRSYNSQTGVPLSLWGLEKETRYAIIEAGISQPGEMTLLEKEIRPEIGIFTNIGAPHSRGFESIEQKCREKALLMKGCRSVVFSADNELISASLPAGPERMGWTLRGASNAALSASIASRDINGTVIEYTYRPTERTGAVTIPFTSDRDIENAMHTLTTLLLLDMSEESIINAMASLRPVVTRLEVADAVGDCQLIHDRFTGDMTSLATALDFARRRLTPGHMLTVITGDPEGQ